MNKSARSSTLQIAIAELEALKRGDTHEAERLRVLRHETAMGMVVNSENTGIKPTRESFSYRARKPFHIVR